MKRISALLLAFTIGVSAFNLLRINSADVPQSCPGEKTPETSKTPVVLISYENVVTKKDRIYKPFFDSFDSDGNEQYFSGWLIPNNFKGMPEVWTILLTRGDFNPENEKLVWSAMVLTTNADGEPNDDDLFESVQIETVGSHLSFKTNKIRGIEYRFDGDFIKNGTDFSEDDSVLRGTMQKIVRGKQAAVFTAKFAYHEPHCFH